MDKMKRLILVLIVALALPLCLAGVSLAADPNLVGNWAGSVPKMTMTTTCANGTDQVTITINLQCNNLFRGTAMVGTSANLIPVTGSISTIGTSYYINLNGSYENLTADPPIFEDMYLNGTYVAGNTPSISVTSFSHSLSTDPANELVQYSTPFSLLKQ